MHEVDLEGQAKVLDVGMLDVDDDLGDPNACVVIATIEHHNAIVWDLRFEDQRGPPLGVTANHPIYSLERDDWVPAGELRIGETVATYDGSTKLTSKIERPGRHSVHNLEVHRSHAYHVSQFGVLAHNTGAGCAPALYDIVKYGGVRASGFEKHHGVLDVWARANLTKYASGAAPAIVLTKAQHNATRAAFAAWRLQKTGSVAGAINWKAMNPREMQSLTYRLLDAANVPQAVQRGYFRSFASYLYTGAF